MTYSAARAGPQGHSAPRGRRLGRGQREETPSAPLPGAARSQPGPGTSGLPSLTAGHAAGEAQPLRPLPFPAGPAAGSRGHAAPPGQPVSPRGGQTAQHPPPGRTGKRRGRLAYGYGRCRAGDWRGTARPRPLSREWSASPLTWGPQRTRCPASSLRTKAHSAVSLQSPALLSFPAAAPPGPPPHLTPSTDTFPPGPHSASPPLHPAPGCVCSCFGSAPARVPDRPPAPRADPPAATGPCPRALVPV